VGLSRPSQGEEIIADIFESMHDLYFLRDAYEGADFVIALALDKMHCKLGIAQLYDINRREFVVAHAIGPNAEGALGNRVSEHDPLIVEIMNRRLPFLIEGTDARVSLGRWKNLGGEPRSILACAVAQGGRFLGILELAHMDGEGAFRKTDVDAMAYIAQSFAEFVARTGLLFGSEAKLMPK
jgi:GAF domain-containing protein